MKDRKDRRTKGQSRVTVGKGVSEREKGTEISYRKIRVENKEEGKERRTN